MAEKLYKGVKLYDLNSDWHMQLVDIKIVDGKFSISKSAAKKALYEAAPAWVDFLADFADPGYEHRETLESGMLSAANAAYAAIGLSPLTQPKTESKNALLYLKSHNTTKVSTLPFATLSCNAESVALSEMLDLHSHGAVAFYDGKKAVSEQLLSKALLYAKRNDILVAIHPCAKNNGQLPQVNESLNGVLTGLKTSPALAEYNAVRSALDVLEYTGGKLHLHLISCKESVNLIRGAKEKGLNVCCSVAFHHLIFTDEECHKFNSNLKVWPPLRSDVDKKALLDGVADGTIDVICSDHKPVEIELKDCEYGLAEEGINALQQMPYVLHQQFSKTEYWPHILNAISLNPAKILGFDVKNTLNIWFAKGKEKTLEKGESLSLNSPYTGTKTSLDIIESLRN